MVLHSYLSGSVNFQTADQWQQKAHIASVPDAAGSFTTNLPQDQVSTRVIAGGQLYFTETLNGYLQYEYAFSRNTVSNGGGIGIQIDF